MHQCRFVSLAAALACCVLFVGCGEGEREEQLVPSGRTPAQPDQAVTQPGEVTPVNTEGESLVSTAEGFEVIARDALDAFEVFGEPQTWSIDGTTVKCSGKPRGYLYTKQSYRNFVLRVEFRYLRPDGLEDDDTFKGNTGILLFLSGEHKLWPACVEVQGKHVQASKIVAIGGATAVEATDDADARGRGRKPPGEWNTIEITVKDGAVTSRLNDETIAQSQPGELKEGAVGFQAEDFELEFRNIRIKEL